MMEHPDSALASIRRINTGKLVSEASKAKYSLLYTMAVDRNGIDTTDYGILADAVKYYGKSGSVGDKVKTCFYQGRLYYNNQEYGPAIKSFTEALNLSKDVDNDWLKGMICTFIALSHNANHNNSEELEYQKRAREYFILNDAQEYIDNNTFWLALAYHNNRIHDKADSLYACIPSDSPLYPSALLHIANNEITRATPNSGKAVEYYRKARLLNAPFSLDMLYQYAYALYLNGEDREARQLTDRLDGLAQNTKTYWWRYKIALLKNDTRLALENLEQYSTEVNQYVRTALSQSSFKAETDYYSLAAERSEQKRIKSRLVFIITLLSVFVVLLVVVISAQKKLLQFQHQKEALERAYYDLQTVLSQIRTDVGDSLSPEDRIKELRSSYISMYRAQIASIGLFVNKDLSRSVQPSDIEDYVGQIITDIQNGRNNPDIIEARVNRDLDNIMVKIRRDFPDFGSETILFLSYVFAGLKNTTIAEILQESRTAVSTRKSRLKKQILSSNTNNKDLYELFLG